MRVENLLADFRSGLEGVTPGPWIASGVTRVIDGTRFMFVNKEPLGELVRICLPDRPVKGFGSTICDQRHIARCSPENIAALLDHIEAISSENEKLKAALECIEAYVSGGFEDGRAPPNRDKAISAARAALKGEQ